MRVSEVLIQPRRIKIFGPDDVDYYRNLYNCKKDLYQAVYDYEDDTKAENAIVDKIFLDFDFNEDMKFFSHVRTVAKYLHDNDFLFYIRFSGNGFHIFILLKDVKLKNPKNAIVNYVKFLHKETETESDPAVVGDLRRVARIPDTLNLKHEDKHYCIVLKYDELMNMEYNEIQLLAKEKRYIRTDFINGHRLLDISSWDTSINVPKKARERKENYLVVFDEINNNIPPCVISMILNPDLGNAGRIQVILFFRDLGYTEEEVEDILHGFLSEEKFNHCVNEEHLVEYLFGKDYIFNDCYWQKENGFCVNKNCKGHKLYY